MSCPDCGAQIGPYDLFCSGCGSAVTVAQKPADDDFEDAEALEILSAIEAEEALTRGDERLSGVRY